MPNIEHWFWHFDLFSFFAARFQQTLFCLKFHYSMLLFPHEKKHNKKTSGFWGVISEGTSKTAEPHDTDCYQSLILLLTWLTYLNDLFIFYIFTLFYNEYISARHCVTLSCNAWHLQQNTNHTVQYVLHSFNEFWARAALYQTVTSAHLTHLIFILMWHWMSV